MRDMIPERPRAVAARPAAFALVDLQPERSPAVRPHRLHLQRLDGSSPGRAHGTEPARWWPIVLVAGLTLAAAIAILFGPAPRYVSEAEFVVRAGLSSAEEKFDAASGQSAMIVAAYLRSRDAVEDLAADMPLLDIVGHAGIDRLSRFPAPFGGDGMDALSRHMRARIAVSIEEASGILALTATAHRPQDAQALAEAMLVNAERLVNGLGARAHADARTEAEARLAMAATELSEIQRDLSAFRSAADLIDPEAAAGRQGALIGSLSADITALDIEIGRLQALAAGSPRLTSLAERRRAGAGQLDALRAVRAGTPASLAGKLSAYELLTLRRELATAALEASHRALDGVRLAERTSRLYLQRISQPNRPDRPQWPGAMPIVLVLATLAGGGWAIQHLARRRASLA